MFYKSTSSSVKKKKDLRFGLFIDIHLGLQHVNFSMVQFYEEILIWKLLKQIGYNSQNIFFVSLSANYKRNQMQAQKHVKHLHTLYKHLENVFNCTFLQTWLAYGECMRTNWDYVVNQDFFFRVHPFSLSSQDYQSREKCSPVNLLYSCKWNSQFLVEVHEKFTRVD